MKFSSQDEVIKYGLLSVWPRVSAVTVLLSVVTMVTTSGTRRRIVGHPTNDRGIHIGDDLAKVSTLKLPRVD